MVFMVSGFRDRFLEAANRKMRLVVFPTGVTHLNEGNRNWRGMNNASFFCMSGGLLAHFLQVFSLPTVFQAG